MPKENVLRSGFNRGEISPLALARVDLERTGLSAETQLNWMPRTLGSMMLRPGTAYIGATKNNAVAKLLPFVFAVDDKAIIELTDNLIRFWVGDALVTRAETSSAITNGTFDTNLTGWTDNDLTGATSAFVAGGYMGLTGAGYNAAIRDQQVTVGVGDVDDEHALRIVIDRGPVMLRVGSSAGADDYIAETSLGRGTHSLAFTPAGDFHIRFFSRSEVQARVDSVRVESSEQLEIATPWGLGDLPRVRWDQSGDVVYVACVELGQRKIERRGPRSWSLVHYLPIDGPFRTANTSKVRLTPSAQVGDITLTASAAMFRSTHVNALFRLTSTGQTVLASLTGENQFSEPIRVTGVGENRRYGLVISGTWTATVTLQQSTGEIGAWIDVATYTANLTDTNLDDLDNQIVFYRFGIKTGDYTSGTAAVSLTFDGGTRKGVVRITGFSSSTSASASVLSYLGDTEATEDWEEGAWSDYRGWPTSVALYEGRLWWAGKDKIWGSVSDAYESFDNTVEGDAGPISRSIGSGPVDQINWLLPMQRLIIGGAGREYGARSSSTDEPLTPTNFNLKDVSTQGSANVPAVKVDGRGIFVQRSGRRVYQIEYDINQNDYASIDLTALHPEIGEPGVTVLAVQRQPDTRVHCVLDNGQVAVLIFDPAENVLCWVRVESTGADGAVEDVITLPGNIEDEVYYVVKRTIGGATKRYIEKWAREDECRGDTVCKIADSHVVYDGASTSTITGLSHLEGEEVVAWGNGIPQGAHTVSGGQITLDSACSEAVVGLGYTGLYKSTKLAHAAGLGTAINQHKRVAQIGLVLVDAHALALRYGPDLSNLDYMPGIEDGTDVPSTRVWEEYDADMFEFPGTWNTDSRVVLQAIAPRPCTVLGLTIAIQTNDKG